MSKMIKKISVKHVCGIIEPEVIGTKQNGKPEIGFKTQNLMKILGVCVATRTGESTYGTFMGLSGQFKATNLLTGEEFGSSQCFLADDLTSLIAAQLSAEGINSVEFGFIIGIKPSDATIGYEYTSESILKTSKTDPIALLEQRVTNSTETETEPTETETEPTETETEPTETDPVHIL